MKKLGFGLMRLPLTDPNNDANVDVEQVKRMVDLFMAKGFTYFDTAIMYNGFASQRVSRKPDGNKAARNKYFSYSKLRFLSSPLPECFCFRGSIFYF